MKLTALKERFCVCKAASLDHVDFASWRGQPKIGAHKVSPQGEATSRFVFVAKTDEELSVVCEESAVPFDATDVEAGWRAFKVDGVLDFSLTGILSGIASVLADAKISIFAVSTFNTDYILIREAQWDAALQALRDAEYEVG